MKATILGDTVPCTNHLEIYKKNRKTSIIEELQHKTLLQASSIAPEYTSMIDLSWVPFAAGHYDISPDLKDYIVVRIPALTSDIPNRNACCFATSTLFEFDPDFACQRYRTFVGRPICKDHNNKILKDAQGIIVDSSLVPVPHYKVVKVMLLALIDRTKCSLVPNILRFGGAYSMGARAGTFLCSVCHGVLGPEAQRTCTCYHTDYSNLASYGRVYNNQLHFLYAIDPQYLECSIVDSPADTSAVGDLMSTSL